MWSSRRQSHRLFPLFSFKKFEYFLNYAIIVMLVLVCCLLLYGMIKLCAAGFDPLPILQYSFYSLIKFIKESA